MRCSLVLVLLKTCSGGRSFRLRDNRPPQQVTATTTINNQHPHDAPTAVAVRCKTWCSPCIVCCCQHLQETFPYTHGTGTADATVVDGYVSLGFSIKRGIVDREKGVEGPLLVSAVHGTGTGGVGTWNLVAAVLCLGEEFSHVQVEPPPLSRQGALLLLCVPLFLSKSNN